MIHEETIVHLHTQREAYKKQLAQSSKGELVELYRRYVDFYNAILEDALAIWDPSNGPFAMQLEVPVLHWQPKRSGRPEPSAART